MTRARRDDAVITETASFLSIGTPAAKTDRRRSECTSAEDLDLARSNARAKLADIVDEVEAGADVELTRRGKKVAVVMSAARYARLRGERVAFMTACETFRAAHNLERAGVEPSWWRACVRATPRGR